ncbi:hypothetical protein AWZ03_011423 [Drosophila navojoa]|uniref:Uncharacterized protein n=1 Tax=Drosophila navojoa TaxID=7232 RepID=A0A484B0C3_DRONA|nr:uncharacterized protein LOC108649852 isoform X1 [Drosophila navojoa]TDG42158.1 hypothetical protein AWZ03_011423 [Drosophila navojoa]
METTPESCGTARDSVEALELEADTAETEVEAEAEAEAAVAGATAEATEAAPATAIAANNMSEVEPAALDAVDGDNDQQKQNNDSLQPHSMEPISMDDIPEPIKVLDDIISEFEEATTKPAALHCNSGENQSEDDGYMSLSRKK